MQCDMQCITCSALSSKEATLEFFLWILALKENQSVFILQIITSTQTELNVNKCTNTTMTHTHTCTHQGHICPARDPERDFASWLGVNVLLWDWFSHRPNKIGRAHV